MKKNIAAICLIAATAISSLCAQTSHAEEIEPVELDNQSIIHGRELAKLNCATCHQIELEGESPLPAAPEFWRLSERVPPNELAQMLLDKRSPKHSAMPTFKITKKQATDIAAWVAWVQPVAHGKRLVEQNCASCHAITLIDQSKHPQAPAFREIAKRFPLEAMEEAFAEGIESGHPDMPVFEVDIIQLQDIISYIASIQVE